jgi:hypothetical protein
MLTITLLYDTPIRPAVNGPMVIYYSARLVAGILPTLEALV